MSNINRCVCGSRAELCSDPFQFFYVECLSCGRDSASGLADIVRFADADEAINAWNDGLSLWIVILVDENGYVNGADAYRDRKSAIAHALDIAEQGDFFGDTSDLKGRLIAFGYILGVDGQMVSVVKTKNS